MRVPNSADCALHVCVLASSVIYREAVCNKPFIKAAEAVNRRHRKQASRNHRDSDENM